MNGNMQSIITFAQDMIKLTREEYCEQHFDHACYRCPVSHPLAKPMDGCLIHPLQEKK